MCAWFFFLLHSSSAINFMYSFVEIPPYISIIVRASFDALGESEILSPTSTNHSHPAASQCSRYVCALCVVAEQPSSLKIYLSAYLSVRAAIKRALRSSVSGFKQSKCGERERCDVMDFKCLSQESSHSLQYNFFCQLISRIIEQFCETFLSFLCCFAFFFCLPLQRMTSD